MPRQLVGLNNNFQSLAVFVVIFIAVVIRFSDRVDIDQVDFGVNYVKGVVPNFIGLPLIIT